MEWLGIKQSSVEIASIWNDETKSNNKKKKLAAQALSNHNKSLKNYKKYNRSVPVSPIA